MAEQTHLFSTPLFSTRVVDSQPKYPYTIENGAGEKLTFVERVKTFGEDRLNVENLVAPKSGPPMHVHYLQVEALTILQGKMGFQRSGGTAQFAGPGEIVVFPAGEAHRFWNAGEDTLRCTGYIEPPGNVEYFLSALFESQRRNQGRRPNIFEVAFLAHRYRTEFGMVQVPAPVQQFLFPVLIAIGSLLGMHERYAEAPEPLSPAR